MQVMGDVNMKILLRAPHRAEELCTQLSFACAHFPYIV